MKSFKLMVLVYSAACLQVSAQPDTINFGPDTDESDSVEYELIVLDPGYESYLLSQPGMDYYSNDYYRLWNTRYVFEWNYRFSHPLEFGDIYEVYIDYRDNIDYGLEVNYRLYYYFRFFEKHHSVDLLPEKVF